MFWKVGEKVSFAKSLNTKLRGCIMLTSAPCPHSVYGTYIHREERLLAIFEPSLLRVPHHY